MTTHHLPPWPPRNEQDARVMKDWVKKKLDELLDERLEAGAKPTEKELRYTDQYAATSPELRAAMRGDLGPPLESQRRELHAKGIDRYIGVYPQKRARGRPTQDEKPLPDWSQRVEDAAADVPRIRQLWLAAYGAKSPGKNASLSAEAIAADRWGVDVGAVQRRLKHKILPH